MVNLSKERLRKEKRQLTQTGIVLTLTPKIFAGTES